MIILALNLYNHFTSTDYLRTEKDISNYPKNRRSALFGSPPRVKKKPARLFSCKSQQFGGKMKDSFQMIFCLMRVLTKEPWSIDFDSCPSSTEPTDLLRMLPIA